MNPVNAAICAVVILLLIGPQLGFVIPLEKVLGWFIALGIIYWTLRWPFRAVFLALGIAAMSFFIATLHQLWLLPITPIIKAPIALTALVLGSLYTPKFTDALQKWIEKLSGRSL